MSLPRTMSGLHCEVVATAPIIALYHSADSCLSCLTRVARWVKKLETLLQCSSDHFLWWWRFDQPTKSASKHSKRHVCLVDSHHVTIHCATRHCEHLLKNTIPQNISTQSYLKPFNFQVKYYPYWWNLIKTVPFPSPFLMTAEILEKNTGWFFSL